MLCEICKKAEAKTVIHRPDGHGGVEELYVCAKCAATIMLRNKGGALDGKQSSKESKSNSPNKSIVFDSFPKLDPRLLDANGQPPQFLKDLVNASISFIEGISKKEHDANLKCPNCGRSFEQILAKNEMGCEKCWETFANEVRDEYLKGQYAAKYVGEKPQTNCQSRKIEDLKKRLVKAIHNENYELAAEIRKELDNLECHKKGNRK